MNINFTYTELSFMREVIHAHRYEESQKFAQRIKKGAKFEVIQEVMKEVTEETNPYTPIGKCNGILAKIQVVEDEIQQALEASAARGET